MKHTVGRVLANPVVRTAVITAMNDVIQLYAKAFVNVVRRKLDQLIDDEEEEQEPQVVEVTLED
jgi:hypothetical protein